jgi:hypothetical protein
MVQVSYIELLSEQARPEPRLCRLLGHVSIYENATRWQRQTMEKIELPFVDEKEKTTREAASGAESGQRWPLTTSVDNSQHVQTFSEFQTMVRSNLENAPLCTVTTTEMTGDSEEGDGSDGGEGSEESEGREFGDGEIGDSISGEGEAGAGIGLPPNAFLLRNGEDVAAEWSSYPIRKGEQMDHSHLWGQLRMLTTTGNEVAFHDFWL